MSTQSIATDALITQRDFEKVREKFSASSLWNNDLAPTPPKKRTWTTWNIAALWIRIQLTSDCDHARALTA